MNIRYYIDRETGQPHMYRHDVREDEAAHVLAHAGEDRPGAEGARIAIGKAPGGRFLRVIYVPDTEDDGAFVITAYELRGKPLAAFKRRTRRRGT